MTARVCLRCDWSGESRSKTCPSCGAPLFTATTPGRVSQTKRDARRERKLREDVVRDPSPVPEAPPTEEGERAVRERPGLRRVAALAIVALAVAAVFVINTNTPEPNAGPVSGLQGWLVYTDRDVESGTSRLLAWDLETGAVREGPEVGMLVEMIDGASGVAGSVGLVEEGEAGEMRASYLDGFESLSAEVPVVSGDLVAWGPLGEHVASVTVDDLGRCEVRDITMPSGTEVAHDPFACGEADSLAQSSERTFLGFTDAGEERIISTLGSDSVTPEVDDARLVAVSPSGRVLAVPTTCRPRERSARMCGGLSLVYVLPSKLDPDGRRELVHYGEPDAVFELESIVGWSSSGDRAYAVGTYKDSLGLWALPVPRRPSVVVEEPIVPHLLLPALTLDIAVTETATGELLVTRAGTLILVRESGGPEYLDPPSGAPPPDGPIVWLRTLPAGPA